MLLDFGGVIAEEGFREGLKAVARTSGLDPDWFFRLSDDLIYETGYVLGLADEHTYWEAVREKSGIALSDEALRDEVLKRFVLRPAVLEIADRLRARGLITGILSDQTNWLNELNGRGPFYRHFDHIFNSYTLGKGKRDQSVFADACGVLGLKPGEVLFIDDNPDNIKRAGAGGLRAVHYTGITALEEALKGLIPLFKG